MLVWIRFQFWSFNPKTLFRIISLSPFSLLTNPSFFSFFSLLTNPNWRTQEPQSNPPPFFSQRSSLHSLLANLLFFSLLSFLSICNLFPFKIICEKFTPNRRSYVSSLCKVQILYFQSFVCLIYICDGLCWVLFCETDWFSDLDLLYFLDIKFELECVFIFWCVFEIFGFLCLDTSKINVFLISSRIWNVLT